MNFMEKFNEVANRTLVPVANKLGNQRHLSAIRDGMVQLGSGKQSSLTIAIQYDNGIDGVIYRICYRIQFS